MTDRILAGAAALDTLTSDLSWDDVLGRVGDPGDDITGDVGEASTPPAERGADEGGTDGDGGHRSSRTAMRLVVLATAAVLLVVVVLAGRANEEGAGVATQPNPVGTIGDPDPAATDTTAAPTTTTSYSKAELYEQARKDLLRNKLHEELLTYLGDRYGGARSDGDGSGLVVLVKGLTPDDQAWLDGQVPAGVIRLEATDLSTADLDQAQAIVNAELPAWSIESWSTGRLIVPPALHVVVQGHHEGLEDRLRSLITVPLVYDETDEPIGGFLTDDVGPTEPT